MITSDGFSNLQNKKVDEQINFPKIVFGHLIKIGQALERGDLQGYLNALDACELDLNGFIDKDYKDGKTSLKTVYDSAIKKAITKYDRLGETHLGAYIERRIPIDVAENIEWQKGKHHHRLIINLIKRKNMLPETSADWVDDEEDGEDDFSEEIQQPVL